MFIYVINAKKTLRYLKFLSLLLVICILTLLVCNTFSNASTETVSAQTGRVIIIDAGHGGEDPGAIGVNGTYEKDINLAISMTLGEELKSRGYTVVYTRTEDKMLYLPEENIKGMRKISDLKNRCKITAEYEDCIVISVHMNSYGASKYSGLQVYYSDENEESREVFANEEKSQSSSFLSGIFKNTNFSLQKLGKEEILLLTAAAFLFFSKEGDKQLALMLLILIFLG